MHRTDLPGQEPRTAFLLVVVRGRRVLATQRNRRRGEARDLAREPTANDPREMTADKRHRHHKLSTRFVGMMRRGCLQSLRIQFLVLLAALCVPAGAVRAQDQEQPPERHHPAEAPENAAWSWTVDGNAFFAYNFQQRKFADFWAWESQNWGMVRAARSIGPGRLTVQGMFSLEPWTIGTLVYAKLDGLFSGQRVEAGGSPQVFQTGESFHSAPIVNYQHPHDLVMGLGASYRYDAGRAAYTVSADLVGSPALGPTPFMHRESARDNPQVPLSHHNLDSTHVTPGVVTVGVEASGFTIESSVFRGEEPDENRLNIDRPRLDSWSARAGWHRGPWQAQVSGGYLHEPEWFDPYDVTRLTASIGFDGAIRSRPLAATLAWGENREHNGFNQASDGYLLEWDLRATDMSTLYGREELVAKQIFGLGPEPRGFAHRHLYSRIDALTLGYVHDLPIVRWSRIGVGADITVYHMSPDMIDYFGGSKSFHAFVRWRPARTSSAHVH
jgi:hypothetical protein